MTPGEPLDLPIDLRGMARAALWRLCRVALTLAAIFGLTHLEGHADAAPAANRAGKPLVLTSLSILADHARAVGGDTIQVDSIVAVGSDPHTYEPVPSDARKLARAQLVLRNGLGLERWLDRLIGAPRTDRPVVTVTDGLVAQVQASGVYAGHPDPHLWMDPVYVQQYVRNTQQALAARFPQHAALFARNAAAYIEELKRLDQHIRASVASIPPAQRQLVTTHDAYRYFCFRYGLTLAASIWGISTEIEPSAVQVAGIVKAVRAARVPTVFVETTINPRLMQRIAVEAGVRIGQPLYGDSVGAPGSGADTYLTMMRANVAAIVEGLGGHPGGRSMERVP